MEAIRFPSYIDDLLAFVDKQPPGSELIFVDDGSTDGTPELIDALPLQRVAPRVRLLREPHRGKGAAIRTGLAAATGDIAGFCDFDLSTSLDDLASLVDAARAAPVLAIGSRDLPNSRLLQHEGRVREFLGRAYNRAVQLLLVPGVVDTQCGAKVARTDVWRRILEHSSESGFAWDVEVIAIARALGIAVQELPVAWRHDARSGVHVARDGTQMLLALPRIIRHLRKVTAHSMAPDTPEVFEGEVAENLAGADATHWWFRSKATFVSAALRRFPPAPGWLVDVGAGSAGVTAMLGWPQGRTIAIDASDALVRRAHARYPIDVVRGDVASIPLANASASVVCLLDVIEHLDDPRRALAEARRVLGREGRLIVTVPAHEWLWSACDDALGHRRRYTLRTVRAELRDAGFAVQASSHIFSWLVPPVWAKRRIRPGAGPATGLEVSSPLIDRAALLLTRVERAAIGRVALPIGTSVLCVAEPIH